MKPYYTQTSHYKRLINKKKNERLKTSYLHKRLKIKKI